MVKDQVVNNKYAIFNGDNMAVMKTLKDESVDLSIYSPPFFSRGSNQGLYVYSSDDRDVSNNKTYDQYLEHMDFIIGEVARITKPGRMSYVHCMDTPLNGANVGGYTDLPGDLIRIHERHGFEYCTRISIWKEPLSVRNRTMSKALAHCQICEDSTLTNCAASDFLIPFRKKGKNAVPVTHPTGLHSYSGERVIPHELQHLRGYTGDQIKNSFSHWIWRHYASSFWDDIRIDNVLPYEGGKDPQDERHCHPLQLDVIERAVILGSNPGEIVFTPFMGVGSEVYGAVSLGRRGIGIELKPSYFRQAIKNMNRVGEKKMEEMEFKFEEKGLVTESMM